MPLNNNSKNRQGRKTMLSLSLRIECIGLRTEITRGLRSGLTISLHSRTCFNQVGRFGTEFFTLILQARFRLTQPCSAGRPLEYVPVLSQHQPAVCVSLSSCRTRLMRIRPILRRHLSHSSSAIHSALELFKCALFLFTLQIAKRCLINFLLFSSFFVYFHRTPLFAICDP